MKKNITILAGDGIGPEIVQQGVDVLKTIEKKYKHEFVLDNQLIGAAAIEKTEVPLPEESIISAERADAVLLGAVGDPKYDNAPNLSVRPEQGLLSLRKAMQLHTNIRPTTIYESLVNISPLKKAKLEGVDFVIYRELASGIYFGEKGFRDNKMTIAYDECQYSVEEINRVSELAFKAAQTRNKKLTLVDKANVLETSRLWRKCVQQLAEKYPDVTVSYLFVDNAAMQLIVNPAQFDVVLTSNMFGDILSDEASVIAGTIGLAPSSSIGLQNALFEPIHGSYPQAAGKNIANPFATILSVAMMMDYFDLHQEANDIREAVNFCIENEIATQDIFPYSVYKTSDVGEIVCEIIQDPSVKDQIRKNKSVSKSII